MGKCEHVWQGDCTGVHCLRCGKRLTFAEYWTLIVPPPKTFEEAFEETLKKPRKKKGE